MQRGWSQNTNHYHIMVDDEVRNHQRRDVAIHVSGNELSNFDILDYVEKIKIPGFLGVYMRDTLPSKNWNRKVSQSGIMNLNTSKQRGVHWVAWSCIPGNGIYYFDSFGQDIPHELLIYLKSKKQIKNDIPNIQRNIIVVQTTDSSECGRLCMYVLKCLTKNISFDAIIQVLKKRYDQTTTTRKTKEKTKGGGGGGG